MIREATLKDIPELTDLLIPFYYESGLMEKGMNLCVKSCITTAESMIESNGIVFVAGEETLIGSLGVFVSPWHFNYEQYSAQEVWFYVKPDHRKGSVGLRLIDAYIKWAKGKNITRLALVSLPNKERSKIERLYERKGFAPSEKFYARRLK